MGWKTWRSVVAASGRYIAADRFHFCSGYSGSYYLIKPCQKWLEHQVLHMMPGYDFLKSMMGEKLHVKQNDGIPVLVQWHDSQQLGILVDEKAGRNVVFFPNGTILGGGAIHVVDATQVTRLALSLTDLDNILIRSAGSLLAQLEIRFDFLCRANLTLVPGRNNGSFVH
jgi:cyanophycinase-like exopeptidase